MNKFINRFKYKKSKAKQAQSRIKQIEKMDKMEKRDRVKLLGFNFPYKFCPGRVLMKVSDLNFSYKKIDGQPNLINNFTCEIQRDDRIGIIGKNGKGKSTLLNLLADELKP